MRCRVSIDPWIGRTWALWCLLWRWRMQRRFRYTVHPTVIRGVVRIGGAVRVIRVWLLFRGCRGSGYLSGRSGIRFARFVLTSAILLERASEGSADEQRSMRT